MKLVLVLEMQNPEPQPIAILLREEVDPSISIAVKDHRAWSRLQGPPRLTFHAPAEVGIFPSAAWEDGIVAAYIREDRPPYGEVGVKRERALGMREGALLAVGATPGGVELGERAGRVGNDSAGHDPDRRIGEEVYQLLQPARTDHAVGVCEGEDFAAAALDPQVATVADSATWFAEVRDRIALDDLGRATPRTVLHDQDLVTIPGIIEPGQ
jgi:hypothetical protein